MGGIASPQRATTPLQLLLFCSSSSITSGPSFRPKLLTRLCEQRSGEIRFSTYALSQPPLEALLLFFFTAHHPINW